MHKKIVLFLPLAILCVFTSIHAEDIEDLVHAIEVGDMALVSVTGTGGSTGLVMEGQVVNQTSDAKKLDIRLSTPLFLKNSGSGQDMVATQIFMRGGGYVQGPDKRSFIPLKSGERLLISLAAYCADFYKENPSREESFTIKKMPSDLTEIMDKISAHEQSPFDANTMISAQIALWSAQNIDIEEIRGKFGLCSFKTTKCIRR